MIKVNLIPEDERKRVKKVRFRKPVVRVPGLDLIISILILIVAGAAIFFMNRQVKSHLARIKVEITSSQKELKRLEKERRIVENIQQRQKELSKWISLVRNLNENRSIAFHLMNEVNRLKPDYMWYILFEEHNGNAKIQGKTFSNLIISNFMVRLKSSPYYSSIELKEIKQNEEKGQEILEFVITANIIPGRGG